MRLLIAAAASFSHGHLLTRPAAAAAASLLQSEMQGLRGGLAQLPAPERPASSYLGGGSVRSSRTAGSRARTPMTAGGWLSPRLSLAGAVHG